MDLKTIEKLHQAGKMPDWVYYQLNEKSAAENYQEQLEKKYALLRSEITIDEKKLQLAIEGELQKVIKDIFKNK